MNVLSNLKFKNSTITLDQINKFPNNPDLGTIIFKDDGLYIYAENILTKDAEWLNLFNSFYSKKSTYIHNQDIESDQWHIIHNLNTQDLFAVVYDSNKILNLSSGIEFINDNEINLNFVDPIKGKAIIFSASFEARENGNGFQTLKAGTVTSLNSNQQPTIEIVQEADGSAIINFGIPKGKSAYELAVENGFVGTEEEWINSLNINIDNKTIIKNQSNILSVSPSGFIDNKTININDEGKLFANAASYTDAIASSAHIWSHSSFPSGTVNSQTPRYEFLAIGEPQFTIETTGELFGNMSNSYQYEFTRSGLYAIDVEYAGNSNAGTMDLPVGMCHFKIGQDLNGVYNPKGIYRTSYNINDTSSSPDYTRISTILSVEKGESIGIFWLYANLSFTWSSIDIHIIKLYDTRTVIDNASIGIDGTTTINNNNMLSVGTSNIIDNNTIVLDKNSKLMSKNIPYEDGKYS